MDSRNESVNKIVIRLHRELDEASRTLGKVRRYGVPAAKAKLVTTCRQRLVSIVSELVTLEQSYAEGNTDNRTTDGTTNESERETTVGTGGCGPVESGEGQAAGPTDSVSENFE